MGRWTATYKTFCLSQLDKPAREVEPGEAQTAREIAPHLALVFLTGARPMRCQGDTGCCPRLDGTVQDSGLEHNELIQYQVKDVGCVDAMNFGIVFSESDDVDNTLLLVPGNYLTSQPTVLAFSPVVPEEAAGHHPRRKFSEHLKAVLS